jgi:hypothetical protein
MNANELIIRAQDLCRAMGRPFPAEIKTGAWDWQRQRYDLAWCWGMVKSALKERRALWRVNAEVHRHHAHLQSERDAKGRKAGEPLETTPATGEERWWETQGPEQVSDEDPQEYLPSPTSAMGVTGGPGGDRPCAEPRQPLRPPRPPYRKRTGTKAHRVREFLRAHVVRRGPAAALRLERLAKNEGLIEEDQTIGRCSTFRRIAEELGIESKRVGFGRGASYVWRLKPPAWTRGLEFGRP